MTLPAPTQNDLAFIACREAFVATTYMDAHAPANGFGINDSTLQVGQVTTMEAAIARFVAFCNGLHDQIEKLLPGITLNQHQFGSLLCLAYNLGAGGPYKGRPGGGLAYQTDLLGAVKAHAAESSSAALAAWVGYYITQSNFSASAGLFNATRRWREAILYTSGDYGDLTTLLYWGIGANPKTDPPSKIPMPKFL